MAFRDFREMGPSSDQFRAPLVWVRVLIILVCDFGHLSFCLFVDVVISEKAGKSSSAESHSSNEPHVPVSEVSHKCNDNHVIENWSLRILKQESHYHHKQMTKLTFRVLALCQSASLFGRYSLKEATGQISNNSIAQAQGVESADNTIYWINHYPLKGFWR